MIKSKYINIITIVLVVLVFLLTMIAVMFPDMIKTGYVNSPEYVRKIFDKDVIKVEITVNEDDWQRILSNPRGKEYISVDMDIDGEKFYSVGLRTKGNSSLMSSKNQKYSFRFNFDYYVDNQTLYGLDKMVVNNFHVDPTYMKDYLSYYLMDYVGVNAPLTTFADIYVNGEPWGFYLACEVYDEAFLKRNYGIKEGQLYSVKNSDIDTFETAEVETDAVTEFAQNTDTNRMGRMQGGGGGLKYVSNNTADYRSIFGNSVFDSNASDYKKVIEAIQHLNSGENIEKYWDVDGILRYLAAHTFVVNSDSYTGSMQQNYYLYEKNGKISVFPWDYNLSFGAHENAGASGTINFPIDTPVSKNIAMEDRPLVYKLLEVEEYKEKYHDYLSEIVKLVNSGALSNEIESTYNVIDEYVKNDARASYTIEEHKKAVESLKKICSLRATSIQGQLDGSIPSTHDGQKENSSKLIPEMDVDMNSLGGMRGMRNMGQREQKE